MAHGHPAPRHKITLRHAPLATGFPRPTPGIVRHPFTDILPLTFQKSRVLKDFEREIKVPGVLRRILRNGSRFRQLLVKESLSVP
ncbi:hypothetical protein CDAR_97831 [Caerostris darwini]|uniref:Uncharacterized protein n=1 Tax=Caerostris darwini TaxID=1538125 RepID=A0AAV4MD96_9ARAC|nr:hypothetical protein CDAR_97831 [Caerostris darwini]